MGDPSTSSPRKFFQSSKSSPFFNLQEKERLAKFFSHYYDMDMLDRELSVKGWNWGTASFEGAAMSFQVGEISRFLLRIGDCDAMTQTGGNVASLGRVWNRFFSARVLVAFSKAKNCL